LILAVACVTAAFLLFGVHISPHFFADQRPRQHVVKPRDVWNEEGFMVAVVGTKDPAQHANGSCSPPLEAWCVLQCRLEEPRA
jgi:hypothetical protein